MMNEREKEFKQMLDELFGDNKTPDTKNERVKSTRSLLESDHKEGTPIETLFTPEVVEKIMQIDKQLDDLGELIVTNLKDPTKFISSKDDYARFQFISVIENIKDASTIFGSCIYMLESSKEYVDLVVGSDLEDIVTQIIFNSVFGK